jgi:glutathione synthase/RimK-type ligase-like ATP-grasp enzyme
VLTLLWGLAGEGPLTRVGEELDRLGAPVWLLDQRDVLDTEVELETGARPAGWVRVRDRRVDLAEVTAAYVRPYDATQLPGIAAQGWRSDAWRHAAAVDQAIACWLELTDALVVNRLSAMAGNASKPWQARRIQEAGFAVPETVVTTEPRVARRFWRHHEQVIYKSVSGVRSRVARLRPQDGRRLADLAACPTQFQRYVPGTDVRVHVVGGRVFATEVACDADDYRYAAAQGHRQAELAPFDLPPRVEAGCRRLVAVLGLTVAGVDLRVTPDDEWYCFEVNPSPAFSYYEHATGQPVAQAVACLLAAAGPVRHHARNRGRP